jgi:hypothetical protein
MLACRNAGSAGPPFKQASRCREVTDEEISSFFLGRMAVAHRHITLEPLAGSRTDRRRQHTIVVMITDRVRAGHTWTIGRDLLLGGLDAPASCLAGMDRVRLCTSQSDKGPSLIIPMMTSSVALLELNLEQVADLAMGTLQLFPQG